VEGTLIRSILRSEDASGTVEGEDQAASSRPSPEGGARILRRHDALGTAPPAIWTSMTGPSQLVTPALGTPQEQVEDSGSDESLEVAGRTPWQLFAERFRQDRLAIVALGFIAVEILLAIFAPLIVRTFAHPPNA
jgi:hypothetical protein